jgi:hypothetical protein
MPITVTAMLSPILNSILSGNLEIEIKKNITNREKPDSNGKVKATLLFDTFEDARTCILGMGSSLEVVKPEHLRLSIADYARQVAEMYTKLG